MTIAKTGNKVQYSGDGATVAFAYGFRFFNDTDVSVILLDASNVETTKVLTTDYTVSNTGTEAGGTITMVTAPASGETLTILADIPETQGTDYVGNDPFPAETHEVALDRLTRLQQQSTEILSRSIRVGKSAGSIGELTTVVGPLTHDRLVRFNADSTAFEVGATDAEIQADVTAAAASATAAATSATNASTSASTASSNATQTASDAAATAADRVQTGLDATATAADVVSAAASAAAADVSKIVWQGAWLTSTAYSLSDAVEESGSSYICIVAHTSGVFATDLAASKWELLAQKGSDGVGAGDMIAANNLSDVLSASTSRTNLGLGTASTTASTDYATSTQGSTADTALQNIVEDTTPQLGGKLDTNAHTIQESIGTAQASASTVTPPTNGNIFHITGTTTVAGFTNGSVGQRYTVIPDGVFTLTNSSTLVIEGAADYTTVVGTSFEIIQDTATVWRVKVPPVVAVSPVKAWVNFNGTGTVAINSSFNVSSITDNGVGDYTINFTTAMADTNYAVLIGNTAAFANRQVVVLGSSTGTPTLKSTTQLRVIVEVAGTRVDLDDISVGIMGN